MENSCSKCLNRNICDDKKLADCDHYDMVLFRSDVINLLVEKSKVTRLTQ